MNTESLIVIIPVIVALYFTIGVGLNNIITELAAWAEKIPLPSIITIILWPVVLILAAVIL